jgi:hypothetical protein
MKYLKYDLNYLEQGQIVEVTLSGNAMNVMLLDSSAFSTYRSGRGRFNYYGGHMTKSPARIVVPRSGHWHLVVDSGGYRASANVGVRVLNPPYRLPPMEEAPLSSVPSLVRPRQDEGSPLSATEPVERQYDVFISHASEDKHGVVRPLAEALRAGGLKVWYDEFELRIGDSLRRKIDRGLANSRFGVVVLSQSFFSKGWTNYELDGLVTMAVSGAQVLLPIWHQVTKDQVIQYSPSLADKLARNTASHTIAEIAAEIVEVIRSR